MENQIKKLYRSKKDRIIAGVCGGLGEYFDIDPVLVRVIFVLLTIINGMGVLLYLILLIVIPGESGEKFEIKKEKVQEIAQEIKESAQSLTAEFKEKGWRSNKRNIIGIIIVLVGFALLSERIFYIDLFRWDLFWSVVIIIIGFYIIFRKK